MATKTPKTQFESMWDEKKDAVAVANRFRRLWVPAPLAVRKRETTEGRSRVGMAKSPFTEATLTYTVKGKVQSKKVSIPAQRHALGILKQREGYVEICWFRVPPAIGGYQADNFKTRVVRVPEDAGLATLWVGTRAIAKAT